MWRGEERVRCMERVTWKLSSVQFSRSVMSNSLQPHEPLHECQEKCKELGALKNHWGWCTVMTQRDVMGREVGGGVHIWERMYIRDRFMSMYGKTNTVL